MGSERAPHHLKGDEVIRNPELSGDGTYSPVQEVLCVPRYSLPLPLASPNGREHQGIWRRVRTDSPPGLDHRTYRVGNWNRSLTRLRLRSSLVQLPIYRDAMRYERHPCPRLPLKAHRFARPRPAEDTNQHQAKVAKIFHGSQQ